MGTTPSTSSGRAVGPAKAGHYGPGATAAHSRGDFRPASRYRLSVMCQSDLQNVARPAGLGTARDEQRESRRFPRMGGRRQLAKRVGAPGRTRTCAPRLRSSQEGDHRGQREAAAPMFAGVIDHPRQPENAPNRHRSSAVCQSESIGATLGTMGRSFVILSTLTTPFSMPMFGLDLHPCD